MALFVLGAGATRGASFVNHVDNPCLPPLDSDFFTQLQRISNPKHQKLITNVLQDVTELFGFNFRVTLETVFSTLDNTIRMLETTGNRRLFRQNIYLEKKERLIQAIAAVLEESLASKFESLSCDHHKKLVEMMKGGDDIISFNYDCLVDDALRRHGSNLWRPRYGYGFKLGSRGSNLTGDKKWDPPKKPRGNVSKVGLLKLHGSLHFNVHKSRIQLKERPYVALGRRMQFTIIPPEWHKKFDEPPFNHIWEMAGKAINKAKTVVLIGYSFPQTDLHASSLFRICVEPESIKTLVIVNPDKESRWRSREVLRRGIAKTTRVLVFDSFKEFVSVDRSLWEPIKKVAKSKNGKRGAATSPPSVATPAAPQAEKASSTA